MIDEAVHADTIARLRRRQRVFQAAGKMMGTFKWVWLAGGLILCPLIELANPATDITPLAIIVIVNTLILAVAQHLFYGHANVVRARMLALKTCRSFNTSIIDHHSYQCERPDGHTRRHHAQTSQGVLVWPGGIQFPPALVREVDGSDVGLLEEMHYCQFANVGDFYTCSHVNGDGYPCGYTVSANFGWPVAMNQRRIYTRHALRRADV